MGREIEGGRTTGKRRPRRQRGGAVAQWGQGATERGRQGREGAGGGGAAAGAGRHGGGCCATRSETEREERGWAAGLYLALPRPDGWRGKACHVSDQRGGTLPRTYPFHAAMHGAVELFRHAVQTGASKSVSLKKQYQF